jgi:hypothetical protein
VMAGICATVLPPKGVGRRGDEIRMENTAN